MNSNLLPVTQVKTSSEILSKKDLFSIFWKEVFLDADKLQCSDIHVEPYNDVLQVRARVNGELKLISKSEEKDFLDQFIVRLKEIARLDISVRDEVQDGDFELKQTKSRYRTVLSPTRFGESFVFRVIKDEKIPKLSDLNLEPRALKDLKYALSHKQGFVCNGTDWIREILYFTSMSDGTGSKKTKDYYFRRSYRTFHTRYLSAANYL